MNTIKRLAIIVVAAIVAAALCSCGKENAEEGIENSTTIIGTWELVKTEYSFNGSNVGTETISENNPTITFREDGYCDFKDVDGPLSLPYKYSAQDKSVSFYVLVRWQENEVNKVTSSELNVSFNNPFMYESIDYDFDISGSDTYKGVTIYRDRSFEDYYCYKKDGKIVPCYKISEDIDGFYGTFSGDKKGYYDKALAHFKRVK